MRATSATAALVAGLGLLATPACSGDGGGATLTVLAAASLTDAFTDVARAFEEAHPGTDVALDFAASSALREQVLAGAPAHVFAAADRREVEALADAGALDGRPTPFATNVLELAVPEGNPGAVTGLADLGRPELLVGLCAPEVPCGRLAREVLARAGIDAAVDTEAPDVRALRTQVASGDLDVGVVYRTEVAAGRGDIEGVALPEAGDLPARYPIAVLDDAEDEDLAAAFVAFVLSDAGQAVLADHGFLAP
jgi:molybdate transport system substrate-binding protein